jgi:bifunctional non-homologous end joining protein LigD
MGLARYKQKRDFNKTPEPKGAEAKEGRGKLSFVIQKHDASRLHYDFRLEMDGVLKSWAVPKGVPIEKGEKRLAMEVEDHPLEYGTFEGTIPEGNYGAGTVMLWDRGTYDVLESDPSQGLKAGKLRILLHGKKLKGEWHLVRMRGHDEGDKKAWLLIKSGETHKAANRASGSLTVNPVCVSARWPAEARNRGHGFERAMTHGGRECPRHKSRSCRPCRQSMSHPCWQLSLKIRLRETNGSLKSNGTVTVPSL